MLKAEVTVTVHSPPVTLSAVAMSDAVYVNRKVGPRMLSAHAASA